MKSLLAKASEVLETNWREGYTIPCAHLYPFQWNWDSGFIAIGWAHINIERAQQEIVSLLKGQWSNGFLPHIVFHKEAHSYFPGPEVHAAHLSPNAPHVKTSGITQPPVAGFVLEEMYQISGESKESLAFISTVYDSVFMNHHYFYTSRDPNNEGLVYICHNWEAGTDNTPVWDEIWKNFTVPEYQLKRKDTELIDASHRPTNREYDYYIHLIELFKSWNYDDNLIASKSPFLVQDPLFNSVLIKSNESLIRLGKLLGKMDKVTQLKQWNELAKHGMNSKLYSEEKGGYVYYDLRNNCKLNHLSSSSFAPLFAGVPTPNIARQISADLKSGRFGGAHQENYLCASFDPTSPLFESQKYWRGPIWINLNWMIYKGLLRYGFHDVAQEVKNHSLFFMEKYGFYEYFEPSKSKNLKLHKGYGGSDFSWSAALTIDFIKK